MNRLNGKTAVITGGATGIGRAAAKRFQDIAEVVVLLASDRGKFLTGVNYRLDGGMTAR